MSESDSTRVYNNYVRANLPNGMSYDTGTDRYDINNHSFFKFKTSNWYYNYISKYGYSAVSAYAVIGFEPALVFDFKGNYFRKVATDSTFPASITHTRASSATMINSSGALVTVGSNVPRTGHHIYNGTAWVNEGILHESEARTNLETESQSLANYSLASNINRATLVTSASDLAGFDRMGLLTSTGELPSYAFGSVYSTATTKTFSVWLKSGTATTARIQIGASATGTGVYADVNMANGTIGATALAGGAFTAVASTIESYSGGWVRASVTAVCPASAHTAYVAQHGGTGASHYLLAPQLEDGSTPSSYIPTSGATVTRAAETLTVPAANLPYDNTNMSIQMDGKMTYADGGSYTDGVFFNWFSGYGDFITYRAGGYTTDSGRATFIQREAGVQDVVLSSNGVIAEGVFSPFNLSSRHGPTFINGAVDGTALTANTTPTALANLSASDLTLGSTFMGTIGQFRMWSEDLTDAGIAEAST